MPYLFITSLGSETNGLLSSIGQLFVYLGLLEAGVGTATLQALFKPVAADDKDGISAILAATNRYYIKTGIYYTVAIVLLALAYPFFVDSALSAFTIRAVILMQGAGQIVCYFTQAKYTLLLQAEGKNYLLSYLMIAGALFRNAGKIAAIALGYGVISVQFIHFTALCANAFIIVTYIHRNYPWIDLSIKPNYEAIEQKNSVLVQSIVWIIFNHTDVLVLTLFTRDLTLVSVYSVYLLVFETIQNVTNEVRASYHYKLGHYSQQSKEELSAFFSRYSLIISAFMCFCFGATYYLSAPFVRLYTARATDANYMVPWLPELFFSYKVLYGIRALFRQPIEASGHFKSTERITITEAVINLVVSIVLVFYFNIYGVLIGTIVALIYSTVAYIRYVSRNIMTGWYRKILVLFLPDIVLVIGTMVVCQFYPIIANNFLQLITKMILPTTALAAFFGLVVMIQINIERRLKTKPQR